MPPPSTGFHHFSLTVRDVDASSDWYERVFGLARIPAPFPHWGDEQGGHAIVLMNPELGVVIGLHHHERNVGEGSDEIRTGIDHLAFGVADRAGLDEWATWLDELGVAHSGVNDAADPVPYSTLVFRDPDNIQLEIAYLAS